MNLEVDKPRYPHDCAECVFLGEYEKYDLYVHPTGDKTVIARWGGLGEYISGLDFINSNPVLAIAYARAKTNGLL